MPNVHLTVDSRIVTIGNTVKVMCRGFGYPPPTLSLSMPNGSVKKFTSPTEFKSNVTIGALAEVGGVYSCSSTNDVGTVRETKIVKGVRQFAPKCYLILYDICLLSYAKRSSNCRLRNSENRKCGESSLSGIWIPSSYPVAFYAQRLGQQLYVAVWVQIQHYDRRISWRRRRLHLFVYK